MDPRYSAEAEAYRQKIQAFLGEHLPSGWEGVGALEPDARRVFVEESVQRYVVALLRQTRGDSRLHLGASPRAGINLLRVAKARALAAGRDYVVPEDVKTIAPAVLAHRLILAPEARSAGLSDADIVTDAVEHTPVPV